MPSKIYSDDLIERVKGLRRAGFSFRKIADATQMPLPSVMYHCGGIKVNQNGHSEILRSLSDIATAFQPGRLPLPNVITEALVKISEEMKEKE